MSCKNWGFCDLSVSRNYDLKYLDLFEKFGFNTIALNSHVEESSDEPKKKKKKGEMKEKKDYIPAPVDIPKEIVASTNLNILQRVTIELSDASSSYKLTNSENLKKYDIIAVVPKTLPAFQFVCNTMDFDIITFEPETRLPYKISRKLYRLAIERGMFFELMYAPAIKDSTSRKNIISTAHIYHAIGKSKNIILTSSAENDMQVRDVHDVINLGFILGLNNNYCLEVIRNNSRKLILKAEGRQRGKFYLNVENEINE